jgi:hypothetical protein
VKIKVYLKRKEAIETVPVTVKEDNKKDINEKVKNHEMPS